MSANFDRPVRPRLKTSAYVKLSCIMGALSAVPLSAAVVVGVGEAPVGIWLRATLAPLFRGLARNPEVVDWMHYSLLVRHAGFIALACFAALFALFYVLITPSSDPRVERGQKRSSSANAQAALDRGLRQPKRNPKPNPHPRRIDLQQAIDRAERAAAETEIQQ